MQDSGNINADKILVYSLVLLSTSTVNVHLLTEVKKPAQSPRVS